MFKLKRNLRINLYLMVLLSTILLSWGMESSSILITGCLGATLGFLVTDVFKLYRLEGVIANIVSLTVLFFAMSDFFYVDGTGKLMSVASMLTYLLVVLTFQKKTPRLIWQLLVLSLLQVVLGAIFSLDFEAGLLFFGYFLVVAGVIFQQSMYIQQSDVEKQNKRSAKQAKRLANAIKTDTVSLSQSTAAVAHQPIVFFETEDQRSFNWPSLAGQVIIWSSLGFAFALALFQLAPRHTAPWYGPQSIAATTTAGVSKSVELDELGQITLSKKMMMRVEFVSAGGLPVQPSGTPYFRGLALSDVVVRNGKTDFVAPYDRVDIEHYQRLRPVPSATQGLIQRITIEESTDPLIYGVFPFYSSPDTPDQLSFCHEISGLTRCRLRAPMQVRPIKYEAVTVMDRAAHFPKSWPYISNTRQFEQKPMSADPAQHRWLTAIDAQQYPTIVGISDQIAEEVAAKNGTRRDLITAIENHFLTPGRYRYTLDYTTVERDDQLDPIEDFVRKHRSGHCEQFAAATTLMLRRQGIPARLVVGYCGGEYQNISQTYMVRASHAHAWVEAYLRPEDCTQAMFDSGLAGPGGAWLIVETTPAISGDIIESSESEAIDLARNVWEDYVLGHDTPNSTGTVSPVENWLSNLGPWFNGFNRLERNMRNPWVRYGIPALTGGLILIGMLWSYLSNIHSPNRRAPTGVLRRLVARAIGLVAPELAQWMMAGRDAKAVEFYQSLEKILADHDLARSPAQTHREFAAQVQATFAEHPKHETIDSLVGKITEQFNAVRFGQQTIDAGSRSQVKQDVEELRNVLAVKTT